MNYSKVKKEFSTFNVEWEGVKDLRIEIRKVWELERYYFEKHHNFNSSSSQSYYYDLYIFYEGKRLELEMLLENYEQRERIRNYEES